MEPHAQNVLLELDKKGRFTGRFVFRDFGGVNIDWKFRKKHGLWVPEKTKIQSASPGNFSKNHNSILEASLHNYFEGGFLFNVQKFLEQWKDDGLVLNTGPKNWVYATLKKELARAMGKYGKNAIEIESGYQNIGAIVDFMKKNRLSAGQCSLFYRSRL